MWLVVLLLACAAGRVAAQTPSYYVQTLELTPTIYSDASFFSWTNAVSDGVKNYYMYSNLYSNSGSSRPTITTLVAVSASTGSVTVVADQTVLYDAFSLAADSSGNVYVLDRNTNSNTNCYVVNTVFPKSFESWYL
jgi:hypothetical protein